jgi:hypothetical protein
MRFGIAPLSRWIASSQALLAMTSLVVSKKNDAADPSFLQDAESYPHLLDLAADASTVEGIRQGLEDVKNTRTRSAREVFDEIRAEYGILH